MSDRRISEKTKILIKARQLISKKINWTINILARNKKGEVTATYHEDAFSFCAWGALDKIAGTNIITYNDFDDRFHARKPITYEVGHILQEVCGQAVAPYNNNHTHEEVLQWFDDAIALSVEKDQLAEKANV
jgi:hypothetical protein